MDIKRITSILLGFPFVVLILTFGNKYIVDICLAFIAMLAMQEYFNAISKDSKPVRWIGYVSCIFIGLIHIIPVYFSISQVLMMGIPTILLILFAQVIFTNMKTSFKDIAYTFFGMAYVIGCIAFIALLRGLDNGRILVWYGIIAAWGTDTFAYLIGKRFGKHKLSKISPKKSIEGAVSGTIGAVLIAIVYTIIMNNLYSLGYSYLFVIISTIALSIIGQLGDFAASSIKRYVDVKDYSNLIPGHGGMLDRIDSLMFLAPFAYIIYSIL